MKFWRELLGNKLWVVPKHFSGFPGLRQAEHRLMMTNALVDQCPVRICVFHVILLANNFYFLKQQQPYYSFIMWHIMLWSSWLYFVIGYPLLWRTNFFGTIFGRFPTYTIVTLRNIQRESNFVQVGIGCTYGQLHKCLQSKPKIQHTGTR